MDELLTEVAGGVAAGLAGDLAGAAGAGAKVGGALLNAGNAKLDYTCWPGFAPVLYGQAVELLPPAFVALVRRLDDLTASMESAKLRDLFVGLNPKEGEPSPEVSDAMFSRDAKLGEATKALATCKEPKLVAELLARWAHKEVEIPAKYKERQLVQTLGESAHKGNLEPKQIEDLLSSESLNRKQVRPHAACSFALHRLPTGTD